MKSECKKIEALLLALKSGELQQQEFRWIEQHIKECANCTELYRDFLEAEKIKKKISGSFCSFVDENEFTDLILSKIEGLPAPSGRNFLETILDRLTVPAFRYALAAILFMIILSFTYQEYGDAKKIILLEDKMTSSNRNRAEYISFFVRQTDLLDNLINLYQFAGGKTPFVDISNDLVLLKKRDLNSLLAEYDGLSGAEKKRIDEFRDRILSSHLLFEKSAERRNEKDSLKAEIERLKKELLESKSQRGVK